MSGFNNTNLHIRIRNHEKYMKTEKADKKTFSIKKFKNIII
jgi:hypothetical protein